MTRKGSAQAASTHFDLSDHMIRDSGSGNFNVTLLCTIASLAISTRFIPDDVLGLSLVCHYCNVSPRLKRENTREVHGP
jgi:hypothetical protein